MVSLAKQFEKAKKKYSRSPCKPKTKHNYPKYIHPNYIGGQKITYKIQKQKGGKQEYFGSYDTIEHASRVVKRLIKCNWDKSKLPAIREELNV